MDERTITTKWTDVAPMKTGREYAASVALDKHRFLVLGGKNGKEILSSIELFDRRKGNGKWKRLSCNIPTSLYSAAAARVGDKVYLIGGSSNWYNNRSNSNRIFALDISTSSSDEWTWEEKRLPSMKNKRYGCAAVANGEFIYVIGGRNRNNDALDSVNNYALDSVERYNIDIQQWETIESMPTKRMRCAAVLMGNKIYVIGGYDEDFSKLATVEVFDLQNQTWESTSTVTDMSTTRKGSIAVAIGRYIVVAGGHYNNKNPFSSVKVLSSAEVLDTSSGNWTNINSMEKSWGEGLSAVVLNESDVYVTGGYSNSGVIAVCQKISLPTLNAITSNHRHKKTPAKKVTKQKNILPIDTEIFISARFRGDVDSTEAEARSLHQELLNLGMKAFMIYANPGDDFDEITLTALFQMKTMVAFCSSEYGAKTSNRYCTYYELKSAHQDEKHIVAIRRCKDWPPNPPNDHDGGVLGKANNRNVFTHGKAYLPWHDKKKWDAVKCAKEVKDAFETRHYGTI